MNISIVEKDITEIDIIRSLWEKLNVMHKDKTQYFKRRFENFTFDQRFVSINAQGNYKFDVILDNDNNKYVGYCLSSIDGASGEVQSIYIEKEYRKYGLGGKLMGRALSWFEENEIANIAIGVIYGNEEALPFYARYGFMPLSYNLKRQK
ncbi:GNAT family N-acetyltransferase [Inconstantimicrobium mannanitabidum]|uniref:N-acetyltransferase n=1 Tax=Inconstantimicrobium mannanitabidum TaxID=1604901 RepID=A0ACB5R8S6_9CLOT|nr:GNAT family N-acetyltransferase [Clostridium sp. TW13]GKX65598.1 N-acetyltransferase [Clostridium sp. TW13]